MTSQKHDYNYDDLGKPMLGRNIHRTKLHHSGEPMPGRDMRGTKLHHFDEPTASRDMSGTKRYRFKAIAIAAALALTLGIPSGLSVAAPPDMPSGSSAGAPPAMPSGSSAGAPPDMPAGQGGPGGPDTMTYNYSGTYTAAATADGEDIAIYEETIEAAESGQNAGLATNGGKLDLANATLVKSGDDTDPDRCNFYGANAIVLAVNEASQAIVRDSALTASSEGSNGLFATDKATIFANNTTIETTADSARGLDATYGGAIVANGLTVSTQGDHCATVATDRGGGNISVTNSTLNTAGSGSPILYSTGDIEVDNVTGTAAGSQLVGMEGLNTVLISDSKLTSTNKGKTGSDPVANGVLIYQSTSGDAEAKTGETALFQATNSKLSSAIESGAMFYLTNTSAKVVLSNTELDFDSDAANLITAAGNDANNWGTAGSNGAIAAFTGINQDLEGNVEVDTIRTVDFFLLDGSTWEGASDIVDNAKASTNAEHLNVYIDSTSEWIVTDDSTVSNLNLAKGGKLVDKQGKAVKVADADGNVLVEGASDIMVYVNDVFSTSVSTTEANAIEAADIDRSAFDEMFGITTTFGENGNAALGTTDEEQEVEATKQAIIDWFHNL